MIVVRQLAAVFRSYGSWLRAGCSTSGSVNCTVLEEQHMGDAGVPVTLTQSRHLQSHTGRYT